MSDLGQNLTSTWIAYCVGPDNGRGRRADALRRLNTETGCRHTNSRLNEWLRGDREPDRVTRVVMLRDCLRYALANKHASIEVLARALT